MASIRKRGSRYQARIHRRGFPTIAKTFLTQRDALQWARKAEVGIEQASISGSAKRLTVSEMMDRYAAEVTPSKKGARTELLRLKAWTRTPIGAMWMDDVRPPHLAKWRDERLATGRAGSTVRNDLNTLSAVYSHAASEWGYEQLDNPVSHLRRPSLNPGRSRRVSTLELDAIKSNTESDSLPAIVDLAVETGMRLSEIVGLRWINIDLEQRTALLPTTKNGHRRIVPLSPKALATLSAQRSAVIQRLDGRVFAVTPHAVTTGFRRAVSRVRLESSDQLCVDLRFHDLRHEAVSRLFEYGLNVMEVALISGHRSVHTLQRYTHLTPSQVAFKLAKSYKDDSLRNP